jgi:hypothetical protein
MKPTVLLDLQLLDNIGRTLALIADGLMSGYLTPTVGDEDTELEIKKNLLTQIEANLSGIETAHALETLARRLSQSEVDTPDNVILFPVSPAEA